MKYIILALVLDAVSGEPKELSRYDTTDYATYEECDQAKSEIGPQSVKDGKVRVFTCATEKQITRL